MVASDALLQRFGFRDFSGLPRSASQGPTRPALRGESGCNAGGKSCFGQFLSFCRFCGIGGGLIYLLLVVAVMVLLFNLITRRRIA